jgi:hypothetical protein
MCPSSYANIGLEWIGKVVIGMVMEKTKERINGCKLIAISFYDKVDTKGIIGCIDYKNPHCNLERAYRKFAFIALKDWEQEEIVFKDGYEACANEGKKVISSQISTIKIQLEKALMDDLSIDIIVERREVPNEKLEASPSYDFLIKLNDVKAPFI